MAKVQLSNPVDGRGQQLVISRHTFLRRVFPIGKEREAKFSLGISQVVDFELLDLLRNLSGVDQQSRHDNQRS